MKLYVIRHAKAEDPDVWFKKNASDDLRPLVEKGQKDAKKMGEWMGKLDLGINKIYSSPLTRAQQTASLIAEGLGIDKIATLDLLRPERSFSEFTQWISKQPESARLAVVGHEPHLSGLISYLMGANGTVVLVRKGAVAELETDGATVGWKFRLNWFVNPKLKLLF